MKTRILSVIFLVGLLLSGGLCMTSCDNDEISTNQYVGGISLNVFGPSPVLRGGELRFLGSGMDRVAAVVFPGGSEVTEITVVSDTEIRVTVPQDAQPGQVVLKTPDGDITTKTELTYLEPVSIESFSPASVRPGDELTITGEYLNLMHAVVFTDEVTVLEENFIEHTRQTIRLIVPKEARSGRIAVSDTASVMPNIMYAEGELTVALPSVPEVVGKTEVETGDIIEIMGQDFDLVASLKFSDGTVIPFEGLTITEEEGNRYVLSFVVPEGVSDGEVYMVTASGVEILVLTLQMKKPEACTMAGSGLPSTVAGEELAFEVAGGEVLTGVKIGGIDVEFCLEGNMVSVEVPEELSGEVTLTLVSGDVSFDYILNVEEKSDEPGPVPGEEVVVWKGDIPFGDWKQDVGLSTEDGFDWTLLDIEAGDVISFRLEQDTSSTYWQLKVVTKDNWDATPDFKSTYGGDTAGLEQGVNSLNWTLTQDDVDLILQNNGLALQGAYITMKQVVIIRK